MIERQIAELFIRLALRDEAAPRPAASAGSPHGRR